MKENDISLREYVDTRFNALEKVLLDHITNEKELRSLNETSLQKALETSEGTRITQTTDILRRLEESVKSHGSTKAELLNFITRELFDAHVKEATDRMDNSVKQVEDRAEANFDGLRLILQTEREVRKTWEGGINTWKWLASFLGAAGVGGVVLLFLQQGR